MADGEQTLVQVLSCSLNFACQADEVYATVHLLHLLDLGHCDLSCRHLFVQPDGSLRLIDFGLAELGRPEIPPASRFTPDACAVQDVVAAIFGSEDAQLLHLVVRYWDGYPWMRWHQEPGWAVDHLKISHDRTARDRDYGALVADEGERRRICPPAIVKAAV